VLKRYTMALDRIGQFAQQWSSYRRQLRLGTHTDLRLDCRDGAVSAHRLPLVSRSPFLAGVLGSVPGDCSVICLPEVKVATVNLLLDVLYSGRYVLQPWSPLFEPDSAVVESAPGPSWSRWARWRGS
jgi:hypothetical protein